MVTNYSKKYQGSVEKSLKEFTEPIKDEIVDIVITGKISGCCKLFIRKEPSASADPITVIDNNTVFTILGQSDDGIFYQVKLESGICGFCMMEFVEVL